MAETPQQPTALEPLRALRYDQARVDLAGVVAPPYDVISPADRELLLQRDPHSVVNLILPESPVRAADLLHQWRRDGVLARDAEPTIWWHEQRFVGPDGSERSRAGFLSAVRLWPYDSGRVRPHEQTHASAKQNRLDLIRATRTNLSPIFGLYDDPDGGPRTALAGVAERAPDMHVLDGDGTDHRFWAVTDPGGDRRHPGGAGRLRDPDRRRPPPVRDRPQLPAGAARGRRQSRPATSHTTSC